MSTHHGFSSSPSPPEKLEPSANSLQVKEFPWIRVDAFDGDPSVVNPYTGQAPHFYLLTHAHTDHITGLNSPNFHGQIYATAVTKHLLLHTMEAGDRVRFEEMPPVGEKRKFANLRKSNGAMRVGSGKSRAKTGMDSIREIQLNVPLNIDGPYGESVTVTAIDANHCPGSCMFLVEGIDSGIPRAVLVTGDIRAEDWWISSLAHNPVLSKYTAWSGAPVPATAVGKGKGRATEEDMRAWGKKLGAPKRGKKEVEDNFPRLDNIYLDTSAVLIDEELVLKDEAVRSLVKHMAEYPPETKFFLNSWTWGYEEMLKGIYKAFQTPIHLDWYKHRIYSSSKFQSTDPLLASLGTASSRPLRFHACERRWKCDQVWGDGVGCNEWAEEHLPSLEGPKKLKQPGKKCCGDGREAGEIVYVNPSEMPVWKWEQYKTRLEETFELARAWEENVGDAKGTSSKGLGQADDSKRPTYLMIPLARHSSLPELRKFVSVFKPRTLYPLTILNDSRQHPCRDYRSLPFLFSDCLAPGGVEQLTQEAETYTLQLVASRAAPHTQPLDQSSMEYDQEHIAYFTNTSIDKAGLNVEGGEEIAELVEVWARLERDDPVPPLSPKKVNRRKPSKRDGQDGSMMEDRSRTRAMGPSPASGGTRSPVKGPGPQRQLVYPDPTSRRDQATEATTTASSPTKQAVKIPAATASGTPLLPAPFFQPGPPTVDASPQGKRRRLGPFISIHGDTSGSFLDPPPAKVVTFVDPVPSSPELGLATATTMTSKKKPVRITARPSLATRPYRRQLLATLLKNLGGLIAPDGSVVPFEEGDPRLGHALPGSRAKSATPEQNSFKTVSASVSASGGSRDGGRI